MNLRHRQTFPAIAASLGVLVAASCATVAALASGCGSSDPTAGFHQAAGEGEDPGDLDGGNDAGG